MRRAMGLLLMCACVMGKALCTETGIPLKSESYDQVAVSVGAEGKVGIHARAMLQRRKVDSSNSVSAKLGKGLENQSLRMDLLYWTQRYGGSGGHLKKKMKCKDGFWISAWYIWTESGGNGELLDFKAECVQYRTNFRWDSYWLPSFKEHRKIHRQNYIGFRPIEIKSWDSYDPQSKKDRGFSQLPIKTDGGLVVAIEQHGAPGKDVAIECGKGDRITGYNVKYGEKVDSIKVRCTGITPIRDRLNQVVDPL